MAAPHSPAPEDPADRVARLRSELRTQHRRYGINESPPQIARLTVAVDRRRSRIAHLERQMEQMETEVARLRDEIAGYAKGMEALLAAEVERIRERFGESWSPVPVLGFRLWWLDEGRLEGARTVWPEPRMTAICGTTNSNPDEVPHSDGRCGRLGCGVYAAKEIAPLLHGLTDPRHRPCVAALVELHGKVVEHEHGYRGARAVVVAVTVVGKHRFVATDDPTLIEALFRAPGSIIDDPDLGVPPAAMRLRERIAEYLTTQRQRRNPWTSASSSA